MSAKKKQNNNPKPSPQYCGEKAIKDFVEGDPTMQKCLELIRDILRAEHYKEKKCPFDQEIALNLDQVEILRQKGLQRDNTVDFVVGLGKNRLLLVEAKLNVNNVDNIPRELPDKITHSMDMLHAQANFVCTDENIIVLLNENRFQERANRLRRMMIAKNKNIKPLTVENFHTTYFRPIPIG